MVSCCGKPATVNKDEGKRGKVWGKLAVFSASEKAFVYAAPLASPCAHGITSKKTSMISTCFFSFPQNLLEHSKH
jgi:hypothetical protein